MGSYPEVEDTALCMSFTWPRGGLLCLWCAVLRFFGVVFGEPGVNESRVNLGSIYHFPVSVMKCLKLVGSKRPLFLPCRTVTHPLVRGCFFHGMVLGGFMFSYIDATSLFSTVLSERRVVGRSAYIHTNDLDSPNA